MKNTPSLTAICAKLKAAAYLGIYSDNNTRFNDAEIRNGIIWLREAFTGVWQPIVPVLRDCNARVIYCAIDLLSPLRVA